MQSRDRMIGDLERNCEVLKKGLEESRSKLFKAETRAKQEASGHSLLTQEVAMLKRHLVSFNFLFRIEVSFFLLSYFRRIPTPPKKLQIKLETLTNKRVQD